MDTRAKGFTLVEILVAVSVIGTLLGLLVPVLGAVRSSARQAGCLAHHRDLHIACAHWTNENRDRIPSINTLNQRYLFGGPDALLELVGDTSPSTPVQTFDWISPVIGESAGLSPNRARRTKQIFEDLGCPSAHAQNARLYGTAPDIRDFEQLMASEGIGQISFLAPGPFHLLGPVHPALGPQGMHFGWVGPVVPPKRYLPRMDRIGPRPHEKVFLADGTRYLPPSGELDIDITINPRWYGSFTSSTPIYDGSTAYGRTQHLPGWAEGRPSKSMYPRNRNLSYRHRGRMTTTFFDGSSRFMTEAESKTDATPWYPTGSVFTGHRATVESLAHHEEDEKIR